ncbi:MAG: dCTP deaminase [Patescibacteria group bacterium]
MLTDTQIKTLLDNKKISVSDFDESNLKAGKYDIRLGKTILKPKNIGEVLDPASPKAKPEYERIDLSQGESYIVKPGEFILGQTHEMIGLDSDVGMLLDGNTTLARLGLMIHMTAMFINPGQDPGIITLEIHNAGPWQIKLSHKMIIGKLLVFEYSENNKIANKSYNKYNAQKETVGALL